MSFLSGLGSLFVGGYHQDPNLTRLINQLREQSTGSLSFSRELLKQQAARGAQQQLALAASARPSQTGLAARTAAQNIGNLQGNLASQTALADIAERQAAQQQMVSALGGEGAQADAGKRRQEEAGKQVLKTAGEVAMIAMLSDKRAKRNIHPAENEIDQFTHAARPVSFQYREGMGDPAPQVGVIAQDLERAPAARQAVQEDQLTGQKFLDVAKLVPLSVAALGRLDERIADLESGMGRAQKRDVGEKRAGVKREIVRQNPDETLAGRRSFELERDMTNLDARERDADAMLADAARRYRAVPLPGQPPVAPAAPPPSLVRRPINSGVGIPLDVADRLARRIETPRGLTSAEIMLIDRLRRKEKPTRLAGGK